MHPALLLAAAAPFPWAGEFGAALSALLWGSSGIVFARIRTPLGAGALNFGKNLFATLCFVVALWIATGSPWPQGLDARALGIFAASGFLGLALCDTFLLRSLLDIGPQRMSLVLLAVPVLIALATALPPFSETQPLAAWVGMAIAIAGICLAVVRRHATEVARARYRRGVRNGIFAALLQTAAVLLARYGLHVGEAPVLESATVRMAAGTLGLALMGLVGGRLRRWGAGLAQPRVFAMVCAASFFGTFLGIYLNQIGLRWAAHAGVATTLNSLMPIYLLPLSFLFLGERFGPREIVATLVAVAGVALMFLGS